MQSPLVSIIVRTNNRPDILKTALNSIRNQTYKNIEVILVEDGKNSSEMMVKKEYSYLNIRYFSTEQKLGRAKVGNIGLKMAKGEYFAFLDDDDEIYPNHLSLLVENALNGGHKVVYSVAEEHQIKVVQRNPYMYKLKRKKIRYRQNFNRTLLYFENYIPIQSVLFSRELYDEMGGFDEALDILEDWDLWVRYTLKTDFYFINEITSNYFVPYKSAKKLRRDKEFEEYKIRVQKKFNNYHADICVGELSKDMEQIIKIKTNKNLFYYLRAIFILIWYWDT